MRKASPPIRGFDLLKHIFTEKGGWTPDGIPDLKTAVLESATQMQKCYDKKRFGSRTKQCHLPGIGFLGM